ncbi:MAG TPA: hypothetical protein VF698_16270 [Thermoanaerobaculia bacterium]|jgi:hypothetical protein
MSDAARIRELLGGDGEIARDEVRRWMASDDLPTLAALYVLLEKASARITPELELDEMTALMRRYLLRCIEEDPPRTDGVHGGFEAAWTLSACMKQWRKIAGSDKIVRDTISALKSLYRRSDETTRNRVLCGVLEHALEDPALRPFFGDWQRNRELREAHKLALEWGIAHEEDV